MIGRFIIECDPENFEVAKQAVLYLQNHTETNDVLSTGERGVQMFATRLKKSIRVRQVRP